MKKRILLAVLLVLSTVLVAPASTQDFPEEAYYWGTGGRAIIMHSGKMLLIEAFNIKYNTYTEPHDVLSIHEWVPDMTHPDGGYFVPLVVITNDEACAAFGGERIFAGLCEVVLADESELAVWSRLKVVLNMDFEVDTPLGLREIHPFEMRLKDQGPGEWTEEYIGIDPPLPSGYTISLRMKAFDATATITGPDDGVSVVQAWVFQPQEMTIKAP